MKLTLNNPDEVIYCNHKMGPCFGNGFDIKISDKFEVSICSSNLSSFGKNEQVPSNYLAGKNEISIKEVEVFHVTK